MSKLGIIQSRGLGDICLALPIAHWYHRQGREIIWPICEQFHRSVDLWVPWVDWRPIPADARGLFFWEEPYKIITDSGCEDILCTYQSLSSHPELSDQPWFQIQKFDEFKYTVAGVPFKEKWNLRQCINPRPEQTAELIQELALTKDQPYYVTHTTGSDYSVEPDLSLIPPEWRRIRVEDHPNHSIFAWLPIIEGSEALIAIDSVIANMVDQIGTGTDLYWIPRSHIHLTPVLGQAWTILDPPKDSRAAQRIFASG